MQLEQTVVYGRNDVLSEVYLEFLITFVNLSQLIFLVPTFLSSVPGQLESCAYLM